MDLLTERMQEMDHVKMVPESSRSPHGSSISDENIEGAVLPDFSDRITILSKKQKNARWCPYLYEVIIYQWVEVLIEQTKRGEQSSISVSGGSEGVNAGENSNRTSGISSESSKALSEVAHNTLGLTIGCAPILFELIKKSLSYRLLHMMNYYDDSDSASAKFSKKLKKNYGKFVVRPDPKLFSTLEKLICVVTDACIDSRNFDSAVFRKTSIDVNDAVVKFLRDLFSVFEVDIVHRLILVYFSRYVVKDGKHWHDRDSKQGWSCSWETCKLRLNAVTLLIRFPEFVSVNKPIMDTWGHWPFSASTLSTNDFFANALNEIETFSMANFSASDGPVRRPSLNIPPFKPHWLAELITDICLSAAEHVDPPIKHRAASLLLEMFWIQSQEGKARGNSSVVASMYVSFIVKILGHINYLSILPHKHQLRKDILPCVIFVMQSAPKRLLRALWRKLIRRAEGKGLDSKYGGTGNKKAQFSMSNQNDKKFFLNHKMSTIKVEDTDSYEHDPKQSILDTYSLLNLAVKTFEYEVAEDSAEEINNSWHREFLVTEEVSTKDVSFQHVNNQNNKKSEEQQPALNTNSSRKWFAHNGAIVILNTSRDIVNEAWVMLHPENRSAGVKRSKSNLSFEKESASVFLENIMNGLSKKKKRKPRHHRNSSERNIPEKSKEREKPLCFSTEDIIIFSRASLSLYLNVLSLNQSDIVIIRALDATIEIVKYFGIQNFFTAVGETFQHW